MGDKGLDSSYSIEHIVYVNYTQFARGVRRNAYRIE
jgi:hypothetical protein